MQLECPICSKVFNASPSRVNKAKYPVTCSVVCAQEQRSQLEPRTFVDCCVCGTPVRAKKSRIDKTVTGIACSRECASINRSEFSSGDGNHQYGKKGDLNASHKSDIAVSTYGYVSVLRPEHPLAHHNGRILLHRLIMEEHLRENVPNSEYLIDIEGYSGKYLSPDVIIHHEDGNKTNNSIPNLGIMSLGDHTAQHNLADMPNKERDVLGRFAYRDNKAPKYLGRTLTKEHYHDAGLDIISTSRVDIEPRSSALINTGIIPAIPDGYVGLVWSRSGLSVKHKIEVGAGCIDSNFRGELVVHLYNHSDTRYAVCEGDKIAQLLTIPVNLNEYFRVKPEELSETDRGSSGFGSSGR